MVRIPCRLWLTALLYLAAGTLLAEEPVDQRPYEMVWAEPDVDHAAWYMQKLVEDPAFRRRIAAAGQATIQRNFSPAAVGRQYAERLEAIRRVARRVAA